MVKFICLDDEKRETSASDRERVNKAIDDFVDRIRQRLNKAEYECLIGAYFKDIKTEGNNGRHEPKNSER